MPAFPHSLASRVACLGTLALLAIPLGAQGPRLQKEIEFARGLARELRFVALAQSHLEELKESCKAPAELALVAQAQAEVALSGARGGGDRERRRTLYREALGRAKERLAGGEAQERGMRLLLVEVCHEFGGFLAEDLEAARVSALDRVPALEEEAGTVLRTGLDACRQALQALEPVKDDDPRARVDYHLTWLLEGQLWFELARALERDRAVAAPRAKDRLEELVFAVGEETALGQRALLEAASVVELLGDGEDAERRFADVIRTVTRALQSESQKLDRDVRALLVRMLEEAYDRRTHALLEHGQPEAVLAQAREYRASLQQLGIALTKFADAGGAPATAGGEDERFGHGVYLNEARALAETGKPEAAGRAFAIASLVSDRHGQDAIGLRAKTLIRDLLASPLGGGFGDARLLLEVAKGELGERDTHAALRSAKRALTLAAKLAEAERPALELEAWSLLARALVLEERWLEATLALAAALEHASPSPEAAGAAELMLRTWHNVRAASRQDPAFDSLHATVTGLAARFGSAKDEARRAFEEGNAALAERDWRRAAEAFAQVPADSPFQELARAREASAWHQLGDRAAARARIDAYRAWLATPAAGKDADLPERRRTRATALAELDFLQGLLAFEDALGSGGARGDRTRLPEVVRLLADYESRHGQVAPAHAARATFLLGRSYVELGELDKAEEQYRILRQRKAADATLLPKLGSAIFTAYFELIRAQDLIVQKTPALADARTRGEQLRAAALAGALEYAERSDEPQLAILHAALGYALDLRRWADAERLGRRALAVFGPERDARIAAAEAARAERLLPPLLARALLQQQKWREAHELLVAASRRAPDDGPLHRLLALALGGWLELDGNQVVRYVGLGRPAEAYARYIDDYQPWALAPQRAPRWSLAWYRFHFEAYWFAAQAAALGDSTFAERAETLWGIARSVDSFAALRALPGGADLAELFERNPPRR